MASSDYKHREVIQINDETFNEKTLKCCQTKPSKSLICVVCGNVFHLSCAIKNKLKCYKICDSRIQCCELDTKQYQTSNIEKDKLSKYDKMELENKMLKALLKEKEDKYNILLENNSLLKQNAHLLEEKLKEYNNTTDKQSTKNDLGRKKTHSQIAKKTDPRASTLANKYSASASKTVNNQDLSRKLESAGTSSKIESEQINLMNEIIYQGENITVNGAGNEDFAHTRSKQNRHNNNTIRKPGNHSKYIGSSEDKSDFTGAKPKVWLYLYRVTRNVNDTQIRKFITKKLYPETPEGEENSDVTVKELQTDPNQLKCFMIGADFSHKEKLYTAEFWPRGVGFRRFDFRRYRQYMDDQGKNTNSFL